MEPISSYFVLNEHSREELGFKLEHASMFYGGWKDGLVLNNGAKFNGQLMSSDRATVPGHPFIIRISPLGDATPQVAGLLHNKGNDSWQPVPLAVGRPN